MPDGGGEKVLNDLRSEPRLRDVPLIVITAYGSSNNAIEALRLGAYDFITKPFDLEEVCLTAERALAHLKLHREIAYLRGQVHPAEGNSARRLIGSTRPMLEVFKLIGKVAETDATVLIRGESGTGKELVAEAIHRHGPRKDKPFVTVNCAALAENLLESELFGHEKGAFTGAVARKLGRFELAAGGAVFLDEIGDLSSHLQTKLLRVIEEKQFERVGGTETISVDFRVIAATNCDLEAAVKEGRFREDLYYRLNVVAIVLPPLRERRADIVPLAEHFLNVYSERNGERAACFSDEAILALQQYCYPGNVRELENLIERAVLMAGGRVITNEHLLPLMKAQTPNSTESLTVLLSLPFHESVAELERRLIGAALRECGGNRAEAARRLGIHRRLLYKKMKQYSLEG